ncbi:MAG: hypothetical protein JXA33_17970 [Anaerolineae bacterium]|nr:hypothetical protein [Anaerolineae bacterium]
MVERNTTSGSSFWRGVGKVFGFLLRVLVILVIGSLIGGGLYYGIPWLYRSFILPVQQNTRNLSILEQTWELERKRWQSDYLDLLERLTTLEAAVPQLQNADAGLRADVQKTDAILPPLEERLTELGQDLGTRLSELETSQSESTTSLASDIETLDNQLAANPWNTAVKDLGSDIEKQISALDARLVILEESTVLYDENATSLISRTNELEGRLALLQTAQDLLKVRLLLIEEDTGGARDTVQLTASHIEKAAALMPEEAEKLAAISERVLALNTLITQRSFRVSPELDALWADVMDMVLSASLGTLEEATPEPETTLPASPIPTPTRVASP